LQEQLQQALFYRVVQMQELPQKQAAGGGKELFSCKRKVGGI
jgi:hypothetical protein